MHNPKIQSSKENIKSIQSEMVARFGSNMVTKKQVGEYTGLKRDAITKFLSTLPYYSISSKQKLWSAREVAKLIEESKTYTKYGA